MPAYLLPIMIASVVTGLVIFVIAENWGYRHGLNPIYTRVMSTFLGVLFATIAGLATILIIVWRVL